MPKLRKSRERVFRVVSEIQQGEFLSYKEVAKRAGNKKAARAVGQILAKNRNSEIPCHRVILSNNVIGGYLGRKNLDWKKAALLLREGVVGAIPTDTIYGLCTSAFAKGSVEKIYELKRRSPKKPCIILISGLKDLKRFEVKLTERQKRFLERIWPAKISVILPSPAKKFSYLHRGTKKLAFRLPSQKLILNILKISGPLLAPSCNPEGLPPAKNIREARRYFGSKIFYLNRGNLISKPSTLIDLTKGKIEIVRKGASLDALLLKRVKINNYKKSLSGL